MKIRNPHTHLGSCLPSATCACTMVIQSTTLRAQLNTISTSTDPAAAYVECFIEEVTATSSRPAHSAIKVKCTICNVHKTWCSWGRKRAHLTGDDAMALAAGTTRCLAVSSAVATQFKTIVGEATDLAQVIFHQKLTRFFFNFRGYVFGRAGRGRGPQFLLGFQFYSCADGRVERDLGRAGRPGAANEPWATAP